MWIDSMGSPVTARTQSGPDHHCVMARNAIEPISGRGGHSGGTCLGDLGARFAHQVIQPVPEGLYRLRPIVIALGPLPT